MALFIQGDFMTIYAVKGSLKPILRQLHAKHHIRQRRRIGRVEELNNRHRLKLGDYVIYHKNGLFYEAKFLKR
jgi:hypothetical protein